MEKEIETSTEKNLKAIMGIIHYYECEVDNGIYDPKIAMIEDIVAKFIIIKKP